MARLGVADMKPEDWLEVLDRGGGGEVGAGGVQYPPATQLVLVSLAGLSIGLLGEKRELEPELTE